MMVITLVVVIIAFLITLAVSYIVFNDVYKVLKLVDHGTAVDIIEFDKCVLPYRNTRTKNERTAVEI